MPVISSFDLTIQFKRMKLLFIILLFFITNADTKKAINSMFLFRVSDIFKMFCRIRTTSQIAAASSAICRTTSTNHIGRSSLLSGIYQLAFEYQWHELFGKSHFVNQQSEHDSQRSDYHHIVIRWICNNQRQRASATISNCMVFIYHPMLIYIELKWRVLILIDQKWRIHVFNQSKLRCIALFMLNVNDSLTLLHRWAYRRHQSRQITAM